MSGIENIQSQEETKKTPNNSEVVQTSAEHFTPPRKFVNIPGVYTAESKRAGYADVVNEQGVKERAFLLKYYKRQISLLRALARKVKNKVGGALQRLCAIYLRLAEHDSMVVGKSFRAYYSRYLNMYIGPLASVKHEVKAHVPEHNFELIVNWLSKINNMLLKYKHTNFFARNKIDNGSLNTLRLMRLIETISDHKSNTHPQLVALFKKGVNFHNEDYVFLGDISRGKKAKGYCMASILSLIALHNLLDSVDLETTQTLQKLIDVFNSPEGELLYEKYAHKKQNRTRTIKTTLKNNK